MRYYHSIEEATEFLKSVLKFLGQHQLPSDPVNYTVWYEYVSKINPQLVRAVDERLTGAQPITDEVTGFWFQEYVLSRSGDLIQAIKTELLKILREVFGDISSAGEDVSVLGKSLAQFSTSIEQVDDGSALQESLKTLLLEVKNFERKNNMLELRLKCVNDEVETLQLKLKEVEQYATTDPLTGLWNRRSFEEKMNYCMAHSFQTGSELSLILLDVDYFKRINDTFGHLAGDDLLRIISKTLKDFVKGKDIVCRYGGEEFTILLPDTPLEGASVVAEKIRKHFTGMSWKQKSTGISMGKITLSAGVSALRPNESMESFVQRADVALYKSKKLGRNQVTLEKT